MYIDHFYISIELSCTSLYMYFSPSNNSSIGLTLLVSCATVETKKTTFMSSNASNSSRPVKRKKKGSSQQEKSSETLPTPAKSVSPTPSGRSSPDPVCSICLGRHESKCFTNNCLHEFCFKCLLEWSKVFPLFYIYPLLTNFIY